MLTAAVAFVVFIAAAFLPDGSVRYGVFESKEECEVAVAQARATGILVTDCVNVELPKPKNGSKS